MRTLLLALLALGLNACTSPQSQSANVRLLLTDAPADEASALTVDFGEVQLLSGEEGRVISETGGSFDVLELRNGQTALLGEADVPDGTYSQLRLIISKATITVDGEDSDVSVPSGAQSGLKVNIRPPLVVSGEQMSVITLDLNARRVIQTGNGGYKLGPTALSATSVSGTLMGRLTDAEGEPLAGGLVTVQGADTVVETLSGDDGTFKLITLLEGSHTVTAELDGYARQSFTDVVITPNEETTLTPDGTVVLVAAPS